MSSEIEWSWKNFHNGPEVLMEASDVIQRIPQEVFDALGIRFFLADELYGFALMLQDMMNQQSAKESK